MARALLVAGLLFQALSCQRRNEEECRAYVHIQSYRPARLTVAPYGHNCVVPAKAQAPGQSLIASSIGSKSVCLRDFDLNWTVV